MYNLSDYSLFTDQGERKYLNAAERRRFYNSAMNLPLEKSTFSLMFHYTGGRLSEITELEKQQIDYDDKRVIIRTLKQRKKNVFRQIPLPDFILDRLSEISILNEGSKVWSFSKRSGSRYIKSVMNAANIQGIKSNARGLRHGFAVHSASIAPLTQVQKWLGHAYIQTTAIYLNVSGDVEREWAERLWEKDELV